MATLWGILGLAEGSYALLNDLNERVVYDAVTELANRHSADLAEMTRVFIERDTTEHTIRYWLPTDGRMQESTRLTRPGAVRPGASYTISFPIRDGRDQLAWDDVSLAYTTVEQLNLATRNIFIRHANWVRYHILKALFNNADVTFGDELYGDLTVKPIANGDATVYPAVIGSESGATDSHIYLPNYTTTPKLSDTNNPFPYIENELGEHFGQANVVTFVPTDTATELEALTAFVEVDDPFINSPLTASAVNPAINVPGQIIGRIGNNWISKWRWMPSNYMLSIDLDQPAPLIRRLDSVPIAGRGQLALVAQQEEFPLRESFWRDRHGFGVGNRLSAVITQINGAAYSIPTAFQ